MTTLRSKLVSAFLVFVRIFSVLTIISSISTCRTVVKALDNGLALTPPLGWQNWNYFRNDINATLFYETALFLETSGLKDAGYALLSFGGIGYANNSQPDQNITRNVSTGVLQADPVKFPGGNVGVARLSNHLHERGFQLGGYTEAGASACNGARGTSQGYEVQDAKLFVEDWQMDYLMIDSCGVIPEHGRSSVQEQARYEMDLWQHLLNTSGRRVLLHNCHNGCASTFAGPTLVVEPCHDDSTNATTKKTEPQQRQQQLWTLAVDGSTSPLVNTANGMCAGCGSEPLDGCANGLGHYGLGMQACLACRTYWNGTLPYQCDENEKGLHYSNQLFNYSKNTGYLCMMQQQQQSGGGSSSCLALARGVGPEVITIECPQLEPTDSSLAAASWDVVSVKEDEEDEMSSHDHYFQIKSRLFPNLCLAAATSKNDRFAVKPHQDPWCAKNHNMWRSSTDTLQVWTRIMVEVESMALQGELSSPGAWSFPDCLEIGVPGNGVLTWEESKSNLALFAVTSSPLFLGNDARQGKMQSRLVELLKNPDMLSINQQYSATAKFAGGRITSQEGGREIWAKPLSNPPDSVAVVLFNRGGYVPACMIGDDKPEQAPCDDNTTVSYGEQTMTLGFDDHADLVKWIRGGIQHHHHSNILDTTTADDDDELACDIFDVFDTPSQGSHLGRFKGSWTAVVGPHSCRFLRISNCTRDPPQRQGKVEHVLAS